MQTSRDKKMDIDRKFSKDTNEILGMQMDMDNMANRKMDKKKLTGMKMDTAKSKHMKMDMTKSKDMKMDMDMGMSHNEMGMDMNKMKRLMEGYKYHVMLDITSKLMFCWNVNYSNRTVSIRVTCQLPPNYWFGVGFSDYGEVTDADFVVFWNDPVSTHHLQDSYTDSNGVLHADHSLDYTLHRARTEDGLSILEYTRPFDTCDERDYLLDNGTTHIVYFVSKGTPSTCVGKDVRDLHHGFQRVQLLKPDVHLPPLPTDVWTFEITAPKVKIPGSETTYWWFITTLPILHHKHHIVRYEGVIQKENEDIVHHIEVFHCVGRKHVHPYSGPKVPEGKMDPTSDLASCRNVIGAWAMGAEPIIYPEEAGSPIGGEGFSPFILLEVHYHNPHLRTGHVDSSGIRFYIYYNRSCR
ncbi:dopamine beta-hydroxylase [Patella vulgata]|uniref:dopamine beta-hydroxylase n=1 Tax=Patella vulgata TaxID=6465 RepID=UPI00217FD6F8|nr:dopamine beta-hydroxylase [Patella vulgata]